MADDFKLAFIKDLRPGAKNIHSKFIVLDIGKPNKTKDGHEVRSCRVADKTGSVNLSVWDEWGTLLQCGDIIRLSKGYATIFKGAMTVYISKTGSLERIGDFCMLFAELPNMSDPNAEFIQQYKKASAEKGGRDSSNTHTTAGPPQPPPPPPHGPPPTGPSGASSAHSQAPVDPRSARFHPYPREANQPNIVNAAKDPRLRNRGGGNGGGRSNGAGGQRGSSNSEIAPKNIINVSRDPRNRNR